MDFTKRNWPLDIVCTLFVTAFVARGLYGIATAVESLSRPHIASAQTAQIEDPLEALRNDPETAGAFVSIKANANNPPTTTAAEAEKLWHSKDEVAVDTAAWHDGPLTMIHRH